MLAEPVEAPPTILSYLEENDFSGNHSSEETTEAAKLKEQGTASFFSFFFGGGAGRGESGHLCSLGLSLSLPSVWKATVVFWVLPRMENPMVLDILCVRKELAQQTFGLWNCSLLDCNLLIAAKVSGSNHSHHSTHLSLFTPHRGLSRSLLLNMQRIDLPIYSVEVSVTELWIIF